MTNQSTRKNIGWRGPRLLAERALPQDGEKREGRGARRRRARSVTVNLAESPLGWLHARGHLSDRQFDAGEKLRADWERANLAPSVTMRWDGAPVAGSKRAMPRIMNETEAQIAAKQRFDKAICHLGNDLSDIAWRTICGGERTPVAERKLGWPARSGKLVLKIALDRLAEYYRLPG
ncbi:DUF6456 domain-containing protein [Sphingorhabdus sp. SMR4y]|uniref:DUF6456 domain-containing protein n=1 Tax=Sphingorhabdus sp. SMR4y TaxID=2584094 RepID=UPI000B5CF95E|nr:DUF6456 domain-containing protein [Sphingorhabdus sp. SMR4y]ASK88130.1 hypothetical protein SPHFLASMR4Y_01366 [Sphingorhabdus sp. SMR4y]